MAGYWIVRGGDIKDTEALAAYVEAWKPLAQKYGAQIISGALQTREGPAYPRTLIVQFDSFEQAVGCYDDPEYQVAKDLAQKAYDRELVILDGG